MSDIMNHDDGDDTSWLKDEDLEDDKKTKGFTEVEKEKEGEGQDDVVVLHDQLPSVEDYKAQVGFRNQVKKSSRRKTSVTTDSEENRNHVDIEDGGKNNDLNRLDDIMETESSSKQGTNQYGRCLCIALCIVVLAIAGLITGIIVGNQGTTFESEHASNQDFVKKNGSQRLQEIIDFLVVEDVSPIESLTIDKESPQHIAAQWMAHGDEAELDVPSSNEFGTDKTEFIQRYSMAVLFFALNGYNWEYSMNFLSKHHICTWYAEFNIIRDDTNVLGDYQEDDVVTMGIHACTRISDASDGGNDDGQLVPYSIFLPKNNLVGTIPDEIQHLKALEVLTMNYNPGLTGTIPSSMKELPNLRYLALQYCDFSGTIPNWIGNSANLQSNLQYLALSNNRLESEIPNSIAKLTNLELLALDDNRALKADIELFHTLKKIKYLYLEDNHITGTITEALMASWPELRELDLSDNMLEGELPTLFFYHHNDLQIVDLHGNNLIGKFPEISGDNFELQFLALQDNALTGTIPDRISNFKNLKHLDLDNTSFENVFNPNIGELASNLEYLFLGGNYADYAEPPSEFPEFIFQLTNLKELSLKGSRLKGSIPGRDLAKLSNLELLDLHYNEFTGTIPSQIGKLTNLKHLLLKKNKLQGQIPAEMAQLTQLQVLLLDDNDLSGTTNAICAGQEMTHSITGNSGNTVNPLLFFSADCKNAGEIACSCCTVCCEDDDPTCNAGEWDAGFDPIWEYGYERYRHSFDMGPHTVNLPP